MAYLGFPKDYNGDAWQSDKHETEKTTAVWVVRIDNPKE